MHFIYHIEIKRDTLGLHHIGQYLPGLLLLTLLTLLINIC